MRAASLLAKKCCSIREAGVNCPPQSRHIAYVFQTLALFPHMTAEQNVAYGLDGVPHEQRSTRIQEIMRVSASKNCAPANRRKYPVVNANGSRSRGRW